MLTIIGCGNLNRMDDGVGARVVQRLAERLRRHPVPGVQALECGTSGMEVMFAARGSEALLVVDASLSGAPPGTLHEVPGGVLEAVKPATFTLHDFRWQHALAAGRAIFSDEFPTDVQVWLVEAQRTELGCELSPAVEVAAERVFLRLLRRIASYAAGRHQEQVPLSLTIRRGAIQLPAEVHSRYFDGRSGVALLAGSGDLQLVPLVDSSSGRFAKQKNLRGDCALDASSVLRELGWDELGEYDCRAQWNSQQGALVLSKGSREDGPNLDSRLAEPPR